MGLKILSKLYRLRLELTNMQKQNISVLVAASPLLDSYALSTAFAEQGITSLTSVAINEEEIVKQVVKHAFKVIALDIIEQPLEQAQALIHALKVRTGCHIVAIGSNEQIAFYRTVVKAGAQEYVLNPVEAGALNNVDFQTSFQEESKGQVISVVGSKGGVGASTIAANLARELHQRGDTISVADMDFSTGDLDLQFDVQGNTSLVEMLQFPERLEPVVYERSAIQVGEGISLFTGYLPLDVSPFWPEKSALDHFRKFCLSHSDKLILDLPSFSLRDQIGFSSLAHADVRVIVVEPTLASIRNAGQILSALESSQQPQSGKTNVVVANHTKSDKASLISCHDIQRALGFGVDVVMPFAPTHFLAKGALGQSSLKGNRKVNRAFAQLADLASGQVAVAKPRFWRRGA